MKSSKKLIALFLSLALLVAMVPQTAAQAATKTQSETLLVGEVVSYQPFLGTIKSVSTNKKAVATVKKKDGKAVVTAKKAGKAVITIKSTRGINKVKLTIKKTNFTYSMKVLENGYVLIGVKNNTSIFMDSAEVAYTLKNPEGEVIESSTCNVYDLMPKKTAYARVYYSDRDFTVSIANSSCSVKSENRSLSAKYKSRISTTKVTVTEENKTDGKLTLKFQNNYSGSITGMIDILFYDEAGTLTYYTYHSIYMKGKEITTDKISTPYNGYSSYKIITRTYSKTY